MKSHGRNTRLDLVIFLTAAAMIILSAHLAWAYEDMDTPMDTPDVGGIIGDSMLGGFNSNNFDVSVPMPVYSNPISNPISNQDFLFTNPAATPQFTGDLGPISNQDFIFTNPDKSQLNIIYTGAGEFVQSPTSAPTFNEIPNQQANGSIADSLREYWTIKDPIGQAKYDQGMDKLRAQINEMNGFGPGTTIFAGTAPTELGHISPPAPEIQTLDDQSAAWYNKNKVLTKDQLSDTYAPWYDPAKDPSLIKQETLVAKPPAVYTMADTLSTLPKLDNFDLNAGIVNAEVRAKILEYGDEWSGKLGTQPQLAQKPFDHEKYLVGGTEKEPPVTPTAVPPTPSVGTGTKSTQPPAPKVDLLSTEPILPGSIISPVEFYAAWLNRNSPNNAPNVEIYDPSLSPEARAIKDAAKKYAPTAGKETPYDLYKGIGQAQSPAPPVKSSYTIEDLIRLENPSLTDAGAGPTDGR